MYKDLQRVIEKSKNVVFFGGAGVSTESNIPDFRSPQGLYRAERDYGYSPEVILSHDFYVKNNDVFYKYYKENLIYTEAVPNEAHLALSRLEREGKVKAVITQNIDGLHQMAGSKAVYELHGSVLRNYCEYCGAKYDLAYVMDEKNCKNGVPFCEKCGNRIKPDVVLYGESLDSDTVSSSVKAIEEADTLIIGGTSLAVYPAAGLINYFQGDTLILINLEETPYDGRADLVIHDEIGKVMEYK